MKAIINAEQDISILPEGDSVHTFYNSGPMLAGADWSKEDIIDKLRHSDFIELTGEVARSMKHGLCAYNKGARLPDVLFIESDEEKITELERQIAAAPRVEEVANE